MTEKNRLYRLSGLLYLIVVITGMFSLVYVPKQLFIYNNPTNTYNNILNNETLFRLSIVSSVVCYISFGLLPLYLYRLLRSVDEFIAKLMVFFAVVSVPISIYNLHHKYAILSLVDKIETQDISERYIQTMIYLKLYDQGIFIATIFWGLWLLPFGYLVYKSGFMPKVLGILLMLGCFGYVINFFGHTLSSDYKLLFIRKIMSVLPSIGELSTCLWLLYVGFRNKNIES